MLSAGSLPPMRPDDFRVEPDVRAAATPPRELYGDPAWFDAICERVLARTWHVVARLDEVAHLGNGSSMCAMQDGVSVATTMGFTAVDGLPMGTRSGAIDPGVILYLLSERGMSIDEVTDLLYHRSGLLGVSGMSNDMRNLLASPAREAADAVDLLVYWIGRDLGSLTAALRGLDVLVFTAGIGEHTAPVRARV